MTFKFFIRWALLVDIIILNLKISKIRFRKELTITELVTELGFQPGLYDFKTHSLNSKHIESQNARAEKETKHAMLLNLHEELGLKSTYPDLPNPITWVILFLFKCQ